MIKRNSMHCNALIAQLVQKRNLLGTALKVPRPASGGDLIR
jgi:hypothetical protein